MARDESAPAIRTHALCKRYGDTRALEALELAIERGEVYGYLGPNGSGKTTTIRLLLGLHRPSAGRAELFGIDAWREPVAAHRRVAYVAGEPFLWPALTGAETFTFLARVRGGIDEAYRDVLIERFKLDADKKVRARASAGIAYGLVAVTFLWQLTGSVLGVPRWLVELTPFAHVWLVPTQGFNALAAVVMLAIAALCSLAALWLFRRRDLVGA